MYIGPTLFSTLSNALTTQQLTKGLKYTKFCLELETIILFETTQQQSGGQGPNTWIQERLLTRDNKFSPHE